MNMSLPDVNGASRGMKYPNRTMADWGSPLPTRKLSPHDDVHFDSTLKPRAHRMVGKWACHQVKKRVALVAHRSLKRLHLSPKYCFSMCRCK